MRASPRGGGSSTSGRWAGAYLPGGRFTASKSTRWRRSATRAAARVAAVRRPRLFGAAGRCAPRSSTPRSGRWTTSTQVRTPVPPGDHRPDAPGLRRQPSTNLEVTPEKVAEVIVAAATSTRPRSPSAVGAMARTLITSRRLLPDVAWDIGDEGRLADAERDRGLDRGAVARRGTSARCARTSRRRARASSATASPRGSGTALPAPSPARAPPCRWAPAPRRPRARPGVRRHGCSTTERADGAVVPTVPPRGGRCGPTTQRSPMTVAGSGAVDDRAVLHRRLRSHDDRPVVAPQHGGGPDGRPGRSDVADHDGVGVDERRRVDLRRPVAERVDRHGVLLRDV